MTGHTALAMTYDPYFHNAPTTTKETVVTGAANTITAMTTETKHKGRWHNLKKDPNDLPLSGDNVMAYWDDDPEFHCVAYYHYDAGQWYCGTAELDDPTHWRHLDTPEEAQ